MSRVINMVGGGAELVSIDGVKVDREMNLVSSRIDIDKSPLPYDFYEGSAVALNNAIYIMGGGGDTRGFYKWNGSSWTALTRIRSAHQFSEGSAVVLNGEIHILGGWTTSTYYKKHSKWDGSDWVNVSTLPYNFYGGSAVVYNNEIHIIGGVSTKNHYKYDGSVWTAVSTLPNVAGGYPASSAVVLNGEIHSLGIFDNAYNAYLGHFKWNGTSWVSVSTMPNGLVCNNAVVLNGEVHIFSGNLHHYSFSNLSWKNEKDVPYNLTYGSAVVLNGDLHILGGSTNATTKRNHFIADATIYKE